MKPGESFPMFVVYVNEATGQALVRGKRVIVEWSLGKLGIPYRWNREWWGAVVDASAANDLPAFANLEHEFAVVTSNPPPQR